MIDATVSLSNWLVVNAKDDTDEQNLKRQTIQLCLATCQSLMGVAKYGHTQDHKKFRAAQASSEGCVRALIEIVSGIDNFAISKGILL